MDNENGFVSHPDQILGNATQKGFLNDSFAVGTNHDGVNFFFSGKAQKFRHRIAHQKMGGNFEWASQPISNFI